MSEDSRSPTRDATAGSARLKWLKAMYILNVAFALPLGLAVLAFPEAMGEILGVPTSNDIFDGMAVGAVPLGFGLVGVLGLRFPMKLSPILGLQTLYMSLFLIGVILPVGATGQLPAFATALSLVFVVFIVGDVIAFPYSYLFARPEGQ